MSHSFDTHMYKNSVNVIVPRRMFMSHSFDTHMYKNSVNVIVPRRALCNQTGSVLISWKQADLIIIRELADTTFSMVLNLTITNLSNSQHITCYIKHTFSKTLQNFVHDSLHNRSRQEAKLRTQMGKGTR